MSRGRRRRGESLRHLFRAPPRFLLGGRGRVNARQEVSPTAGVSLFLLLFLEFGFAGLAIRRGLRRRGSTHRLGEGNRDVTLLHSVSQSPWQREQRFLPLRLVRHTCLSQLPRLPRRHWRLESWSMHLGPNLLVAATPSFPC